MSLYFLILMLAVVCYIVFSVGRIYELVSKMRELQEKIEQELFEMEMMTIVECMLRKEGVQE